MKRLALVGVSRFVGATPLLRGVDLTITSGESLAVLGPSGAGKSTLLRLLAGLDAPTEGEVWQDERRVSEPGRVIVPPHERCISLVFQDLALWPNLSVLDNVLLGLAASPLARKERRDRALAMLERCWIEALARRLPAELSGGEQQRVAFARALAPEPSWLLLDEPFANLDLLLRERLVSDLGRLADLCGATLVLVTHDIVDALALTHRALVLECGRIVEAGHWEELLAAPRSELLRGLAHRAELARARFRRPG